MSMLILRSSWQKFTAREFYNRTVKLSRELRMRHSNCSRHDNIKFAGLSCIENTSHCQVFMQLRFQRSLWKGSRFRWTTWRKWINSSALYNRLRITDPRVNLSNYIVNDILMDKETVNNIINSSFFGDVLSRFSSLYAKYSHPVRRGSINHDTYRNKQSNWLEAKNLERKISTPTPSPQIKAGKIPAFVWLHLWFRGTEGQFAFQFYSVQDCSSCRQSHFRFHVGSRTVHILLNLTE